MFLRRCSSRTTFTRDLCAGLPRTNGCSCCSGFSDLSLPQTAELESLVRAPDVLARMKPLMLPAHVMNYAAPIALGRNYIAHLKANPNPITHYSTSWYRETYKQFRDRSWFLAAPPKMYDHWFYPRLKWGGGLGRATLKETRQMDMQSQKHIW